MPTKKKKEESMLEKAEDVIKKVAEKVGEVAEEVAEEIKEVVTGEKKTSKKTTKKTTKKSDSDKEDKLAKLKAKAAKLAGDIKTGDDSDLTKKVKGEQEEKKDALAPIEDYLKSSIHLGTRAITPDMRPYIYKRRADSLAVFNTSLLDDKIKEGAEFLAKYAPEDIVVVCKRESGSRAVELFSEVTGIQCFVKNYPAGILTNPNLDNFMEKDLLLICDPWTDKSALADAKRIKIPVMAICDTNNYTLNIDKIVPGNNKSAKSLGFIFYLFAKIYIEKRKLDVKLPPISDWIDGWDNLVPPK
ncbi:MAG: 30S ribosomal protein S2 [Nanoarchaeota archaeon]|nr:30S ribosomal protein S2 [Nanoarchaeota archaeon]